MNEDKDSIGAGNFRTHCLTLINRVDRTKKPMAKLAQIEDEKYSLFGCLENTVEIKADIIEDIQEVWEVDV